MVIESRRSDETRALLGLRPPVELADGRAPAAAPVAGAPEAPARPSYPRVSSGWDSEDQEPRGKSSDLLVALRAGGVLVVVVVALALLLR